MGCCSSKKENNVEIEELELLIDKQHICMNELYQCEYCFFQFCSICNPKNDQGCNNCYFSPM